MNEETVILTADDFKVKKSSVSHRGSCYYRIDEYTLDGQYVRTWDSMAQAADAYGVSNSLVKNCVRGNQLTASKIGRIFLKEGSDINKRLKELDNYKISPNDKLTAIPVMEYDLKGRLTMVYPSISSAADLTHTHNQLVSTIVKGAKLCSDDGKIFLRRGESIKTRLELIKQRNYTESMNKSVDMYTFKGKPNGHFRNAAEAAERFQISTLSILDCCLGITNFCKGNIFLFSGDSINERLKLKNKKK